VNPLAAEKMQNVLKRKNMQKYFVTFLQGFDYFPDIFIKYKVFSFRTKVFFFHKITYVLDHSASFDMHIEKLYKKKS